MNIPKDANAAYLILQKEQDSVEKAELEEALVLYLCELAVEHEAGNVCYAREMTGYLSLHDTALERMIASIKKDTPIRRDTLAQILRGYQLYHQYCMLG